MVGFLKLLNPDIESFVTSDRWSKRFLLRKENFRPKCAKQSQKIVLIIASENLKEHVKILGGVLNRLANNKLEIK